MTPMKYGRLVIIPKREPCQESEWKQLGPWKAPLLQVPEMDIKKPKRFSKLTKRGRGNHLNKKRFPPTGNRGKPRQWHYQRKKAKQSFFTLLARETAGEFPRQQQNGGQQYPIGEE
jgi:hypothetical protein